MLSFLKQFFLDQHNLLRLSRRQIRQAIERKLSEYPPECTKNTNEILADLRYLVTNRHLPYAIKREVPEYFESGMHFKGADITCYMSWLVWVEGLQQLFSPAQNDLEIIHNKELMAKFFSSHGFRAPAVLGELKPGMAADILPPLLEKHGAIFCKPLNLWGGRGCMKLEKAGDISGCKVNDSFMPWEQLEEELRLPGASGFVLGEYIYQHETMASLHPQSINTLRLVTIRDEEGHVFYYKGIIRIGRGGACVDNASKGGFFVGLHADGTLMESGLCHYPGAPIPMLQHPDTGVVFKGMQVPFFEETKQMVCAAHKVFSPNLIILSWDIAITPTGPAIIEVNDYGAIRIIQRAHGGCLSIYQRYMLPALRRMKYQQKTIK